MIDKDVIERKVDIIELALLDLEEISNLEDFLGDRKSISASKYNLIESIEACLDIASHIISSKGFRRPENYKDVFKVLEENKIIPKNLSRRLEDMAKFRNLLIHRYEDVDSE